MTTRPVPEIPKSIADKMLAFSEIRLEAQSITAWGYKYFLYFKQSEQIVGRFKDLESLENFLDSMLMADPEKRNFTSVERGFKIAY